MSQNQYKSKDVAQYMRAIAFDKKLILNVTQVQKLLYIIYGYYLAKYEYQILDEQPKAWPFGPVFPKTRKIDYQQTINLDEINSKLSSDQTLRNIIETIVNKYGKIPASQLTAWSHQKNSPWDKTKQQKNFKWNDPISNELIQNYFGQFEFNF